MKDESGTVFIILVKKHSHAKHSAICWAIKIITTDNLSAYEKLPLGLACCTKAPEKCLEYFLAVLALDKRKEATGATMHNPQVMKIFLYAFLDVLVDPIPFALKPQEDLSTKRKSVIDCADDRAPAQVQHCQKKWFSCLTPCLEEEETVNSPTGKESGLVLPALPYLFGDSMLVDSALQLLQLCSNGSELCCPHCLTQDLPTVPATSNPGLSPNKATLPSSLVPFVTKETLNPLILTAPEQEKRSYSGCRTKSTSLLCGPKSWISIFLSWEMYLESRDWGLITLPGKLRRKLPPAEDLLPKDIKAANEARGMNMTKLAIPHHQYTLTVVHSGLQSPGCPFAEDWLCLVQFGKGLFLHSCGRLVTPQGMNCLWRELCSASTCTDFILCPCLENISRVTFSSLLVTHIKISTVLFTYMEISPSQKPQSAALDTIATLTDIYLNLLPCADKWLQNNVIREINGAEADNKTSSKPEGDQWPIFLMKVHKKLM
ncbi:hypothetical protein Nmel_009873 [Mimus melanotis]